MTLLEFIYLVLLFLAVAFELIAAAATSTRTLRFNFVAAGLACFFLMLFIQALDRTFP